MDASVEEPFMSMNYLQYWSAVIAFLSAFTCVQKKMKYKMLVICIHVFSLPLNKRRWFFLSQRCKGTFLLQVKLSKPKKEPENAVCLWGTARTAKKQDGAIYIPLWGRNTGYREEEFEEHQQDSLCAPSEVQAILAVLPWAALGINPGLSETSLFWSCLKLGIFWYVW